MNSHTPASLWAARSPRSRLAPGRQTRAQHLVQIGREDTLVASGGLTHRLMPNLLTVLYLHDGHANASVTVHCADDPVVDPERPDKFLKSPVLVKGT